MTTTTPPPPPSPSSQTQTHSSSTTLLHNVSLGALIVCPIIILLPPRKLDIYTLGLLGGMFLGGNQLSREYTGVSMVDRMSTRVATMTGTELPPRALEMQRRLREEKMRREGVVVPVVVERRQEEAKEGGVLSELKKLEGGQKGEKGEKGEKSIIEKVWMGGEGEDWKRKRDEREKKALEEGKGYGDLIMDQIWEVWNWGEKKVEEVKEVDEKVVAEQKRKQAEGKK